MRSPLLAPMKIRLHPGSFPIAMIRGERGELVREIGDG